MNVDDIASDIAQRLAAPGAGELSDTGTAARVWNALRNSSAACHMPLP